MAFRNAPILIACAMSAMITLVYGFLGRGVFTLEEVNLDSAAAMTLILAATAQTIVLLRGGIDLSIGGMISLGTVVAATQFGDSVFSVMSWSIIILGLGFAVGAMNGLIISIFRLQPFLVTLATWSILSGIAMIILPTGGGSVPGWWVGFANSSFLGLVTPVWALPCCCCSGRGFARHASASPSRQPDQARRRYFFPAFR